MRVFFSHIVIISLIHFVFNFIIIIYVYNNPTKLIPTTLAANTPLPTFFRETQYNIYLFIILITLFIPKLSKNAFRFLGNIISINKKGTLKRNKQLFVVLLGIVPF